MSTPTPRPESAAVETAAEHVVLGRQPILDRHSRIVAYELLFRRPGGGPPAGADLVDGTLATGQVLVTSLNRLGWQKALGDKKAFVNVTRGFLASGLHELLPPGQVVLEILEHERPDAELLALVRRVRDQGYEIALDDFVYAAAWEPLLELASFVKVDIRAHDPAGLAAQLAWLRGRRFALLAEKVETHAEFERCLEAGFEYFQGFYFARPEVLAAKTVDPARQTAVEAFNLAVNRAEVGRIERVLRRDAALCVQLFKFINSPAVGLAQAVHHIRHALVVLGYDKLARWLTLLLMT
jgi:EAL and modified HD-GYP domain-containing signal transduction protein